MLVILLADIKDYFMNNEDEDRVSHYIKAGGSVAELSEALGKLDLRRREQTSIVFSAIHLVVVKSVFPFINFFN